MGKNSVHFWRDGKFLYGAYGEGEYRVTASVAYNDDGLSYKEWKQYWHELYQDIQAMIDYEFSQERMK
jgi:hypothetical protein